MTIINPQQQHRQTIHKAAQLCADYQDAWQHWLLGHTVEKALTLISKAERLLIAQNETGLNMQDPDKVRHRILTCKQYLEDTASDIKSSGSTMTEEEALKRVTKRNTALLKRRK